MRKLLCILLVISAAIIGISAAEIQKDFRYTDVDFTPIDTNGTEDISDDILLPAVLGDLLPDGDGDGFFDVSYVLKKNGKVASTNPGQLYGVITVNNTTATTFTVTDVFGTQFNIHPAKLCGGVDIIRVDAGGYATELSGTDQVVSATVDNEANTVSLEIALDEPLATDEELMIYMQVPDRPEENAAGYCSVRQRSYGQRRNCQRNSRVCLNLTTPLFFKTTHSQL